MSDGDQRSRSGAEVNAQRSAEAGREDSKNSTTAR